MLIATAPSAVGVNSSLTVAAGANFADRPAAAGQLSLGSGVLNLTGVNRIGTALGGTPSQSQILSTGAATVSGLITVDVYGIPGVALAEGSNDLTQSRQRLERGGLHLGYLTMPPTSR